MSSPRFFNLSTQNGLSQDSVIDMHIDSTGYLYVGTESGLNRWDGYKVKRILGANEELDDVPIYRIVEDSQQNLWLSALGDGAYRYTPTTGELKRIDSLPYKDDPNYLQEVVNLFEDQQGNIVITMHEAIAVYSRDDEPFEVLFELSDESIRAGNFIRWSIQFDEWIIVASTDGLYATSKERGSKKLDFLPNLLEPEPDLLNTKHLYFDSQERLWISTVRGLYYSKKSDVLNALSSSGSALSPTKVLENSNVWRVLEYETDKYWIGTSKGLYSVEIESEDIKSEYLFEPLKGTDVLSRKDIFDIEIDRDNNLWLATNYGGALYWSPDSLEFDTLQISVQNKTSPPLTDNTIWSLMADDKFLWVGTDNGLTRIDQESGESLLLYKRDEYFPYSESYIDNIFDVDSQKLILQTGIGLWQVDKETNERGHVDTNTSAEHEIVSGYVAGSGQDAQKRIWFGLNTIDKSGYFIYDPFDLSVTELPFKELLPWRNFGGFLGSSEEFNDSMLLSTTGKLSIIDPITFAEETLHEIPASLHKTWISPSSVAVDAQGVLWIGYPGHGLYGIERSTLKELYFFDDNNLLPTNLVYSVMIDEEDNLWFSSHSGLHQLSTDRTSLKTYAYGQELSVSEFNDGANVRTNDGRFAYGSPNGIVQFDPAKFNRKVADEETTSRVTRNFAMAISDVSLASRQANTYTDNNSQLSIELEHDDYGLAIRFSSLRFGNTSKNRYRYSLVKDGKEITSATTSEPIVTLPVLDDGNYVFSVVSENQSGDSSLDSAVLNIRVNAAPWDTPLAKFTYFLIALSIIALVIWVRRRQLRTLQSARNQVRLFGTAFKQTRDWVVIFDKNRQPMAINNAFASAFGIDANSDISIQINQINRKYPSLIRFAQSALTSLDQNGYWRGEKKFTLADDKEHDVLISINSVIAKHSSHQTDHFLMVFSDISEQKKAERKLLKMATYDDLTGLVNRNLLLDRLEHAIENAKINSSMVAVLFVDLDRFKGINDSLGHDFGDSVLREIAKRMLAHARENDTVGRIGGDEFVIILEDVTNFDDVSSFIARLVTTIEEPIYVEKESLSVSCSVGVSVYPNDGKEPSELLRFADVAMYAAKNDPVNSFQFFTESMNVKAKYRLALENLVKQAHQQRQFYNVYQPIVNIKTNKTEGMELLLRCDNTTRPISPAEFIPILEELRLIVEVTKQSISEAIVEVAGWYKQGFNGYLSVNLSALHFSSVFDLCFIKELLDHYQLPLSAIRFEVTESVLMGDKDMALEQFRAIKNAGLKLALDDFGTGYSSLSYLKIFPLDVIKIDKSFIDDIGAESSDESLVLTTIGMAQSLKLGCIAEGVETLEQVEFLRQNNCHLLQGYFFSKPVNASHATDIATKDWQ